MGAHSSITAEYGSHESSPTARASRRKLSHDLFAIAKERGTAYEAPETYESIRVPHNNPMAVASGLTFGTLLGFGLTWQIWWLAILGALAGATTIVGYGVARLRERTIPARNVELATSRWLEAIGATAAISRAKETTPANRGLAKHDA